MKKLLLATLLLLVGCGGKPTPSASSSPAPTAPVVATWDDEILEEMDAMLGLRLPYDELFGEYDVDHFLYIEGDFLNIYMEHGKDDSEVYGEVLEDDGFEYLGYYEDDYGDLHFVYGKYNDEDLEVQVDVSFWLGYSEITLEEFEVFEIWAYIVPDDSPIFEVPTNTTAWDDETFAAMVGYYGRALPYIDDFGDDYIAGREEEYFYLGQIVTSNIAEAYALALDEAGFTFDFTEVDDYGDTWYCYSFIIETLEVYIDYVCYEYEGDIYFELYMYYAE